MSCHKDSLVKEHGPAEATVVPYFPEHTLYEVSWPVFSDDGQLAMIYEEKICGIECGGGQINIFHKDAEGRWVVLGVLPTKVS